MGLFPSSIETFLLKCLLHNEFSSNCVFKVFQVAVPARAASVVTILGLSASFSPIAGLDTGMIFYYQHLTIQHQRSTGF